MREHCADPEFALGLIRSFPLHPEHSSYGPLKFHGDRLYLYLGKNPRNLGKFLRVTGGVAYLD